MQNAHMRLGLLEYNRNTEKTSTRIRVRVPSGSTWSERYLLRAMPSMAG